MRVLSCVSPLLFLLPALSAQQSVVSPGHFTSAEASSNNRFPFGDTAAPFRYVAVHDDLRGTVRVIKGFSLRRDATDLNLTPIWPAHTVTLDAWCSEAATTSTSAAAVFDNNHGTLKMQVVTSKTFNFPQTEFGHVPGLFVYTIVFDTPYPFLGNTPLCWEVQITARTTPFFIYQDAGGGSSTNPNLAITTYGAGCKVTTQTTNMSASGASTMSWSSGSGNLTISGGAAPANAPILVIIGFSNTSFFGIPLPFLLPGTTGAPSGPCTLYTSIAAVLTNTTGGSGTSSTQITVPATPDLNGGRAHAQIVGFDAAANPFGVALSNSVNLNWVAPWTSVPVARVWLVGGLGPTGSVGNNYGMVIRFDL